MLGDKNAYILNKLCQNFIFFDDVFWELAPRRTEFVVDRTADLTATEGEPGQSRGALLRTQCGSGLRRWASKEHNQILQKTGTSLNDPRQVGAASTKSAHCYREEKRRWEGTSSRSGEQARAGHGVKGRKPNDQCGPEAGGDNDSAFLRIKSRSPPPLGRGTEKRNKKGRARSSISELAQVDGHPRGGMNKSVTRLPLLWGEAPADRDESVLPNAGPQRRQRTIPGPSSAWNTSRDYVPHPKVM